MYDVINAVLYFEARLKAGKHYTTFKIQTNHYKWLKRKTASFTTRLWSYDHSELVQKCASCWHDKWKQCFRKVCAHHTLHDLLWALWTLDWPKSADGLWLSTSGVISKSGQKSCSVFKPLLERSVLQFDSVASKEKIKMDRESLLTLLTPTAQLWA